MATSANCQLYCSQRDRSSTVRAGDLGDAAWATGSSLYHQRTAELYGQIDWVALTPCCTQLQPGVTVESVKFGERCVVFIGLQLCCRRMKVTCQSRAKSQHNSPPFVGSGLSGGRCRGQTADRVSARHEAFRLQSANCCHHACNVYSEGMVQTTNLKKAAKAEVASIIPWLQVRILPVPVFCGVAGKKTERRFERVESRELRVEG